MASAVENYVTATRHRDAVDAEIRGLVTRLEGIAKVLSSSNPLGLLSVIRYPIEDEGESRAPDDDDEGPSLKDLPTADQIETLLFRLRDAENALINACAAMSEIEHAFVSEGPLLS
jgi:hypothetical protein